MVALMYGQNLLEQESNKAVRRTGPPQRQVNPDLRLISPRKRQPLIQPKLGMPLLKLPSMPCMQGKFVLLSHQLLLERGARLE
mmetsp:Transcript_6989/g.24820  ORF Transcript_6989/g.24820 Transcript_6989/m.24820 type:complete len:83 (-) Transcript_6989:864-1112(-)